MEKLIKWFAGWVLLLIIVLTSVVAPIDFTPLEQQPFYHRMIDKLDTLHLISYKPTADIQVGWSQFSIVPDYPMPMAGYKPRDNFTAVHDSVYLRILAVNNGSVTTYFITADLLIFPPALKELIYSKFQPTTPAFLFFNATHTHTSLGGWDPSLLGNILMGSYDDAYIEKLASKTVLHMAEARESMRSSSIAYWEKDVGDHVANRIVEDGNVDNKFRGLTFKRDDGSNGMLLVFGAHPTSIYKKFTVVSGDFPSNLIRELSSEYSFSEYMTGVIGSQRISGFGTLDNFELTDSIGKTFHDYISEAKRDSLPRQLIIKTARLIIEHDKSQLRLTGNLRLRDWLFRLIIGPLKGEISIMLIGDVLMLGTSTDFAGEIVKLKELDKIAEQHGLKLIITSFNGEYTGYITEDSHYVSSDDEEVRILNWVGPYFGEYYSRIIKRVIENAAE